MIAPRGFTLLIALILTSVLVSIGLALIDVSYKQLVLASTVKNSQIAFYKADAALECALYYDQKLNAFHKLVALDTVRCAGRDFDVTGTNTGATRTSQFSITCPGGGETATVRITKNDNGATTIYANGYSACSATDLRRVERGLKVTYSGSP